MTDLFDIKFFYPMLFTTIGIILIVLICAIKAVMIRFKDKDSENFIFKTHTNEHIDTTDKMKSMHDNVIKVNFTSSHEKELDILEKNYEKLEKEVKELNEKFDILLSRIIKLENNHT